MKAYLLTWNPNRWDWYYLEEEMQEIRTKGKLRISWSCGTRKNAAIGCRVFLMRLGLSPKGIFGSGWIVKEPYPDDHWDENSGSPKAMFIDADFDVLLNPLYDEILSLKCLENSVSSTQLWTPQSSGIEIVETEVLESVWTDFLLKNGVVQAHHITEVAEFDELESQTIFFEGKPRFITSKTYERNRKARTQCLAYYGYKCQVCNFDFELTYGNIGKEYIQVHHCIPLAEINENYQVNPIEDLILVCANCHAMLHRHRPALTIDELKSRIRANNC